MASSSAVHEGSSSPLARHITRRAVRKGAAVATAAGLALAMSAMSPTGAVADEHNVVANGLNSPRHLSFAPNGDLYIAESGLPFAFPEGFDPETDVPDCDYAMHPQFGPTCLEGTSSITLVTKHGKQSRVVTGLPALSNSGGEVNGAFDVLLHGNTLTVAMGLGAPPSLRDAFDDQEAASVLGTVIEVKQTGKRQQVSTLADLAAFEATNDDDERGPDSNPADLAWSGRDLIVTDAGANAALTVSKKGAISAFAVFTDPVLMNPPFPGAPDPFPAQPVPTAAAQGPDGAWYFSQLTGFPFQPGTSTIWRLAADGDLEPYATGLTNVTDLAWDGNTLYAVQIADAGLLTGPIGSLVEVTAGADSHEPVAGATGLFAPYGVAIKDGHAYVTVGSVAPGGSVIEVDVP